MKSATRDPIQIDRWWRNRRCNIGIAAGTGSDLTIIDLDDERAKDLNTFLRAAQNNLAERRK